MTYGLKVRTTEDEWDAVEDENSVARIMRMAQRNAQRAIQGYQRACYLCGASGAGKTFVLNKAIEGSGLKVIRTIPKDYYDLIHAFDFSQGKIPLVFEECDHLFRSPRCLNLLKIATDAAGAQSVRVRIPPKKRSEDSTWKAIPLTAPVAFALNSDLSDRKVWPKECLPHIEALLDRETPIVITAPREAWWEYSTFLALRKQLIFRTEDRKARIPLKVQNKAIAFFAKTAWQQTQLSPRRLVKIAGVLMADFAAQQRAERQGHGYDQRALEEDLAQFLNPGADAGIPSPFAPPIFLRPRTEAASRACLPPAA
jgi:hypothetical protein